MPIEFAERIRRIPVYPAASGYDLGSRGRDAGLQRVVLRPAARGRRGGRGDAARRQPLPRPGVRAAAARRWPTATASRRARSRSATGRATSCSPPARRCSSPAPSSSTPGRRSACTRTSPPPPGPGRSRSRSTTMTATTSARCGGRSPWRPGWCSICNPNNPTSTCLPLEEVEEFLRSVPRQVCVVLDEAYCEFALTLGDTQASVELLARHPNLVLLRTFSKVYGLAGMRVGYGLCGSRELAQALDQVRQPFYLNAAAQAAAVEALAPRRRGRAARGGDDRRAARARRRACARSGCEVAESDANFIWALLPDPDRRGGRRRRPARAGRARPRRDVARPRGGDAGDRRDRRRERAVPRRARRARLTPAPRRTRWRTPGCDEWRFIRRRDGMPNSPLRAGVCHNPARMKPCRDISTVTGRCSARFYSWRFI